MTTTTRPRAVSEGTTLAWTEHYGDALTTRDKALELGRDLVFAITLAVMVAGALGFITHAPSSERMARTTEAGRAL